MARGNASTPGSSSARAASDNSAPLARWAVDRSRSTPSPCLGDVRVDEAGEIGHRMARRPAPRSPAMLDMVNETE